MFRSSNQYAMPLLMWFFPLFFFAYQFILRLWPGLMMHPIMNQFGIDASHFGLLAAVYYYGYAGMQIPVAMLLERYGPRRIIFVFAVICGLATIVFSYTNHWFVACLSRFLVGAGSAAGFLGVSKVISEWFPSRHYARMVGFSFTVGLMGAIYGGKPVSLLIASYPWQNVALTFGIVAIAAGFCTLCFLRSPGYSPEQPVKQDALQWSQFKMLLSSPWIWILALANALMVGSLEGFADVWGVPYLMTTNHIPKSEAAQLISFIFIGMLFGGPLLAMLSKKMGNYPVIALCGVGMAVIFLLLLNSSSYHWYRYAVLFSIIGILCCYQVIVFAAGSELVSPRLLGVTVAFLNCVNMLGGSLFHTLIGGAMDKFWSGTLDTDGLRLYSSDAYTASLQIIPYGALTGAGLILLIGYLTQRKSRRREALAS
ncbi:MFS transporter [Legionella spiritensis]|uniref:Lysosomal dipeptide transporter MFSD1 n=1 Tax=Legionella spiritensis TaxID=452 RepID=A0A0W0Z6A6_LEGSP|nr:MFS transporter [Legionella spiritensis]KTD64676.1 major facilitator family transporter [Legionella spiritensis]SNV47832.1 major facilitator family transporter [Legionella spiritensis]